MSSRFRLGIDIGGTFTDATLVDESTGDIRIGKVPTTPDDPSRGFLDATRSILRRANVAPVDVGFLVHATTVATNAIIEEKIAPTGFVTTDGFRDLLEIARQIRPSLYDLQFVKPRPLVPRLRCFGVPERLDARGNVLLPLDEDEVRRVASKLRDEGVEAIALCFLHAYLNPSHERRAGAIIRELLLDMGGTTAKAGLIQDGVVRVTKDYEVGAAARNGVGSAKGGGYPIRTPVVDLVEIGAGGGSIASVDSGGGLRVGPRSAGADPGPACYGRGGKDPTITDADLVLGRLNPHYFLGGDIRLDPERARESIQEKCAGPLGLGVLEVVNGIVEIANAAMVNALRLVSVQRGYDPRGFVLIAFGGAGPVHANRLAVEIGIPLTLIPLSPGITSALGLLVTDLKHDYSTTLIRRVDLLDLAQIEDAFQAMTTQGRAALARDGVQDDDVEFVRQVEMRYVGQGYELAIALPETPLDSDSIAHLTGRFHQAHDRAYGFSAPSEMAEFVTLRLTAIGRIAKPPLRRLAAGATDVREARKSNRLVYFAEAGGFVDCPIYDRYRLPGGGILTGPAVVEEFDSTTVIHPGYEARIDECGNLLLGPSIPRAPFPQPGGKGRQRA